MSDTSSDTMFGKLSAHLITMFLVSMLLVMSIAVPGILAGDGYTHYDQVQLNATIAALVHSNGPVTQVGETLDHSSFSIRFANDLHIQLPCDYGRHYYKNVNTCVSTSKMVIIYDHCQVILFSILFNVLYFTKALNYVLHEYEMYRFQYRSFLVS